MWRLVILTQVREGNTVRRLGKGENVMPKPWFPLSPQEPRKFPLNRPVVEGSGNRCWESLKQIQEFRQCHHFDCITSAEPGKKLPIQDCNNALILVSKGGNFRENKLRGSGGICVPKYIRESEAYLKGKLVCKEVMREAQQPTPIASDFCLLIFICDG